MIGTVRNGKLYPYVRSPDQDAPAPVHRPVVIIGGGPVGLTLALDLGLAGVQVVLLDENDGVGIGSRAICFAQRTLEIAHRLGCGAPMLERGVRWNIGKVFFGDRLVYEFDLLPEDGHRAPAFVNLQQYHVERMLVERIREAVSIGAPIEIRGRHRVEALELDGDAVALTVGTRDGPYELLTDWLVACDGARSPTRTALGLDFDGRVFEDHFLIADVSMSADFPTERWFWFEPPFEGAGQSALLHKQPDDVWRIDFQLGGDIDRERELDPARVRARVDAMLGEAADYELEWTSVYTFQCRRMQRFRHGRVLFAGDAAHQVSPFGARGANSGIQDADALGWRLALVARGAAPAALLDGYASEREFAADENIRAASGSTDFITPKSETSRRFRNAVLELAEHHAFARPLVNSGRLSTATSYHGLAGAHAEDRLPDAPARARPGCPCPDARLADGYLLDRLGGRFVLLLLGDAAAFDDERAPLDVAPTAIRPAILRIASDEDAHGLLAARLLGDALGAVYLVRPDQHIVARWPRVDVGRVSRALALACRLVDPMRAAA